MSQNVADLSKNYSEREKGFGEGMESCFPQFNSLVRHASSPFLLCQRWWLFLHASLRISSCSILELQHRVSLYRDRSSLY